MPVEDLQQRIFDLTQDSDGADEVVGALIREQASDPHFAEKLTLLDKYVDSIKKDTFVPGIPATRYSEMTGGNGKIGASILRDPIVHDGLRSVAEYTADRSLDYNHSNPDAFFAVNNSFDALEERLRDLKEIQQLTGIKDSELRISTPSGNIAYESFDKHTSTAREIYASFATYRDAFPDDFAQNGEKLYLKYIEDRGIPEEIGQAREKLGEDGFKKSMRLHYNEFSMKQAEIAPQKPAPTFDAATP